MSTKVGPADWIRSYRTKEDNAVTAKHTLLCKFPKLVASPGLGHALQMRELLTIGLVTEPRARHSTTKTRLFLKIVSLLVYLGA